MQDTAYSSVGAISTYFNSLLAPLRAECGLKSLNQDPKAIAGLIEPTIVFRTVVLKPIKRYHQILFAYQYEHKHHQ